MTDQVSPTKTGARLAFCVGAGDLNSVPHACASALARLDSSPAPLRSILGRDSNLTHEELALLTQSLPTLTSNAATSGLRAPTDN